MQELRDLARKLLVDRTASVVIGYEEGPRGVRPAFITDPAAADRLVFDARCVHNLAVYLSPRRAQVVRLGRPAVVVKGCDARAVAGLLRENQIRRREDVVIIGVRCGGVLVEPTSTAVLGPDTVAPRCRGCEVREPGLADHKVGVLPPPPPDPAPARLQTFARIEAMTPAERWTFWQGELERCLRCHACREVCPLCYCETCVADKSQPQWIESSPHPRGNFAWNTIRALHLAGRCVGCGECERACPVDIPLGLLNRKMGQVVAERFEHRASDDPAVPCPIGTFRTDDGQEFIS